MFLNRKKPEDRDEASRQLVISFKKFFGTDEGRAVLCDLVNRFYVLRPLPHCENEFERGRCEGQRDVVLQLLNPVYRDLAEFEKVLKGEFT